jgi:hypothetical protein
MFAADLCLAHGTIFNQGGDAILPSPSLTTQRAEALVDSCNALIDAVVKPPPPPLPNAPWQKHSGKPNP